MRKNSFNKVELKMKKSLILTFVLIFEFFISTAYSMELEKRITKYDNGQPKEKGQVYEDKDGIYIKTGLWQWWYQNGKKQKEGNYEKDKEHGQWIEWYSDGAKAKETNYKNGKKEGLETSYLDGFKRREVLYKNDKKNGHNIQYCYMKNSKEEDGDYFNDIKKGKWIEYFCDTGNVSLEEVYDETGKLQGELKKWYSDGNLMRVSYYSENKIIASKSYYEGNVVGEVENGDGVIITTSRGNWGPKKDTDGALYSCKNCIIKIKRYVKNGEVDSRVYIYTNDVFRERKNEDGSSVIFEPGEW